MLAPRVVGQGLPARSAVACPSQGTHVPGSAARAPVPAERLPAGVRSAAASSLLSRLLQGTFCSPTRVSTCTLQHGNRRGGQFCAAALLRFFSVQPWSKTQALRVTAQAMSKHPLAAPEQRFPPMHPHALGTVRMGWGHTGAVRAICHPGRSGAGVGAALLPLPAITTVLQTKTPCSETSSGAIWHF